MMDATGGAVRDPNDAGATAARARVAVVLERFSRVELQVVVVAAPDARRRAAVDLARSAAIVAGRGERLAEAVAAAREVTIRAFARGGFSGTWAATDMAVSVTRAEDRVAAAAALEEATIAAAVEDLVDDETLEVLRSTWDELASLQGIPSPGSLSAFTAPAAGAVWGPLQIAIVIAFVIVSAVIWLRLGAVVGLVVLVVGLGIAARVAGGRGRSEPGP
ncbi:MAG: hypothetical protein ABI553_00380 [Chloroflexota bacterium]